uniref:THAP-type domain-containing protein n=1 Tax=Plectus sambesii TaxID=2011161 RepID=A0A914X8L7_9BILA
MHQIQHAMPNYCSICKEPGKGGLFAFPSDPEQRLEWCLRLGLNVRSADQNVKFMYICAEHFEAADVITFPTRKELAKSALPISNVSEESPSFSPLSQSDHGDLSIEEDEFDDASITEVCLVYTSQLEALLRAKCITQSCNSPVDRITWVRHGSCYTAKMECFHSHSNSWSSQPKVTDMQSDKMYRGNLDLTTATLAAGLAYADIQKLAEVLDLAVMSQPTFFEHQLQYVMPTINEVYDQHMDQVHEILTEHEEEHGALNYAADAQCDSPGYSANLCCVSFLEINSGLVSSMTVIHKAETETKTSQSMEPFGFRRCLDDLIHQRKRLVGAIATDGHMTINAIMRRDYSTIEHQLDKWHIGKNLKKKLTAAAKTKGCGEIKPWLRSILNHLWFSVDNCSNDPVRCQELFRSIIHHVANEHSWKEDQSFSLVSECCNAQLSAEKVTTTGWLPKQSDAYRRLFGILTEKRLLKNVGRIAKNLTTSAVENYHSVRLTYATKRKAYSYASYRMRSQLAVLHHNFATLGKELSVTAAGTVQRKVAYSKAAGRWTDKAKHIRPTVEWKRGLLLDVRLERLSYLHTRVYRPLSFPNIPANAAPLPRPIEDRMSELLDTTFDTDISDSETEDES